MRSYPVKESPIDQGLAISFGTHIQADILLLYYKDINDVIFKDTISRHQIFINQLIADKKVISEKCEHMAKELAFLERRNRENIKEMESRHAIGR